MRGFCVFDFSLNLRYNYKCSFSSSLRKEGVMVDPIFEILANSAFWSFVLWVGSLLVLLNAKRLPLLWRMFFLGTFLLSWTYFC